MFNETNLIRNNSDNHLIYPLIVMCVMYISISLAAVGGNALVIYTIFAFPKMNTVTNIFIMNLAIGDFLMAVLCIPITFVSVILFEHWPFGITMCVLISYFQSVSVFISSCTLVAISIDRYIAVLYPLKPKLTKSQGKLFILFIWMFASFTALPIAILSDVKIYSNITIDNLMLESIESNLNLDLNPNSNSNQNLNQNLIENLNKKSIQSSIQNSIQNSIQSRLACSEHWTNETLRISYSLTLILLQYIIPVACLIYTYARIGYIIWIKRLPGEAEDQRDQRLQKSKKKIIKMMIIVISVYTFCWLPLNTFIVIETLNENYIKNIRYINLIWFICHWLAMSHTCYNPFIYYYMSKSFRNHFKQVYSKVSQRFNFKQFRNWSTSNFI